MQHTIVQAYVILFKEGVALISLKVDAEARELLESHRMESATIFPIASRVQHRVCNITEEGEALTINLIICSLIATSLPLLLLK